MNHVMLLNKIGLDTPKANILAYITTYVLLKYLSPNGNTTFTKNRRISSFCLQCQGLSILSLFLLINCFHFLLLSFHFFLSLLFFVRIDFLKRQRDLEREKERKLAHWQLCIVTWIAMHTYSYLIGKLYLDRQTATEAWIDYVIFPFSILWTKCS